MNDNKNLIPLAEIAKQINKTPAYLSKLAREGTITAEKKAIDGLRTQSKSSQS
ncbi:hypothetical protein [Vibrio diabolicus]|uniref:hypothetical protein n=1 Tax=Vibrio diabolicus TaxID=50719 RepID=UPI0022A9DF71|nr:hypothetical protein [Vibrio diabolicus]MCZ2367770.1 hypothetical protein [Vibrio diabolicus]MDV5047597.1 hypothetical protein [Vibrio diabolicus]